MGIKSVTTSWPHRPAIRLPSLVIIAVALIGCSKSTDPTGSGALTGVVRVPYTTAATGAPAIGAQVRVTGGDFDSLTTSDSTGTFFLAQVPVGTVSITASLTSCFSGSKTGVQIIKDDTTSVDVTMQSQSDVDTISLPPIVETGSARHMELVPGANRAIMLYDTSGFSPLPPSLLSVNLTGGATQLSQFPDLRQCYDLKIVSANLAVFSFLSEAGFGLRFVDLGTMAKSGNDVIYDAVPNGFPGHIVLDNSAQHIFIAHARQQGPFFSGKVYAVSVAERTVIDADNNPSDGNTAFDTTLIRQSVGWVYGIAYDNSTNEILVANRDAGFITAISWSKWGTFDRGAHLALPTIGVRAIRVTTQLDQFQPWFLGFDGGTGIALWPQSAAGVRFRSGAATADLAYTDPTVAMSSEAHFLVVVPSRQSWFTLFSDFMEPNVDKQQRAVEERSLSTLHRLYRYESHHFNLPDRGNPRTFAVDAANKKLYVAYANRPILEVFCLP